MKQNDIPVSVLQTPEVKEAQMREALKRLIDDHIFVSEPHFEGSKEHKGSLGDAMVGAIDAKVTRTEPPLELGRVIIRKGMRLALVGANGAGKSTFFDSFTNRNHAYFTEGSYGYSEGVHGEKKLRIGRLNQEELLKEIGDMKALDVIKIAIEKHAEDFPVDWDNQDNFDQNMLNQEVNQRSDELIQKMISFFEIDIFLDRKVSELSGGERTKLSLAILLANEPDVLFLDEPTNHLDLESIAKLVGLFKIYSNAGVAIISASHVEWFLDAAGLDGTIEVVLDENKRTVNQSTSPHQKFVKRVRKEQSSSNIIEWARDYGYPFNGTSVFNVDEKMTILNSPVMDISLPTVSGSGIIIITGKNGTGKTKILEEMAKKNSPIIRKEKRYQAAYLPQFWPEDVAEGTLEQFFNWVKESSNRHSTASIDKFRSKLGELKFRKDSSQILKVKLSSLSGGQQKIAWFMAQSLIEGTDMLILDEPTNHMDSESAEYIAKAIQDFPGGVVLTTHDPRLMKAVGGDKKDSKNGVVNWHFKRTPKGKIEIEVLEESPYVTSMKIIEGSVGKADRIKL